MENVSQPPSGGCVLKQIRPICRRGGLFQPPSGGCVLKQLTLNGVSITGIQPPSGGCVLKQRMMVSAVGTAKPAAFGRLCVETGLKRKEQEAAQAQPPSGGCVLKQS